MTGLRQLIAFAVGTLQFPVITAGPFTGDLHEHLCSRYLSEDYGQESRRVGRCICLCVCVRSRASHTVTGIS